MLLVTGGTGFIGSNMIAALNDAGRSDVVVSDWLGDQGKWRNLARRQLADIVPPPELANWLKGRKLDAVIHLGAISETTGGLMEIWSSRPISGFRFGCSIGAQRTRRLSSMPLRQQLMATAPGALTIATRLPRSRRSGR